MGYIDKIKEKIAIITANAENDFNKIKHSLMIKI